MLGVLGMDGVLGMEGILAGRNALPPDMLETGLIGGMTLGVGFGLETAGGDWPGITLGSSVSGIGFVRPDGPLAT